MESGKPSKWYASRNRNPWSLSLSLTHSLNQCRETDNESENGVVVTKENDEVFSRRFGFFLRLSLRFQLSPKKNKKKKKKNESSAEREN